MSGFAKTIAEAWWGWMGPMFWQVTLLGVVVLGVDLIARRWVWPQLRLALWLLVLAKLVVPPVITSPWGLSLEFASSGSAPLVVATDSPAEAAALSSGSTEPAPSALGMQVTLLLLWGAGLLTLGAIALRRRQQLRRHSRQYGRLAGPLVRSVVKDVARQLRLRRVPEVRVWNGEGESALPAPAVIGVRRPCIILPPELDLEDRFPGQSSSSALSEAQASRRVRESLEHVLLHELAHIKRGDLIVQAVAQALQLVYWFHPVCWLAGARARALRELCCDATVATLLRERTSSYRETLLTYAARLLDSPPSRGGALGYLSGQANIVTRLQHLEQPIWKYRRTKAVATLCVAIAVCLLLTPASEARSERRAPGSPEGGSPTLGATSLVAERVTVAKEEPAPETKRDESTRPDDTSSAVQQARETIEAARRGEFRSSLRVRYAAMVLAQDEVARAAVESGSVHPPRTDGLGPVQVSPPNRKESP